MLSPVKSPHAVPPNSGMAGLRRLFHHPAVLADGSSQSPPLARARKLALPRAGPCLDRHVGRRGRAHRPVARRSLLLHSLVVDSRRPPVRHRHLHLFALRSPLQLGTARRPAGSSRREATSSRLVTTGIRSRVRHPVYLAHLCEMLAWSVGTGLAVCWLLTALAILTGAVMIRMEDAELEKRFGEDSVRYRQSVPAVIPRL